MHPLRFYLRLAVALLNQPILSLILFLRILKVVSEGKRVLEMQRMRKGEVIEFFCVAASMCFRWLRLLRHLETSLYRLMLCAQDRFSSFL